MGSNAVIIKLVRAGLYLLIAAVNISTVNTILSSQNENLIHYEIVFTTNCSRTDDLSSYIFFHRAMEQQQSGDITRIVSGCDEDQRKAMQEFHALHIQPKLSSRFHIHFWPSAGSSGLLHWMTTSERLLRDDPTDTTVFVILEPDMLLLRPLDPVIPLKAGAAKNPAFETSIRPGLVFTQRAASATGGLPLMACFSDMKQIVASWAVSQDVSPLNTLTRAATTRKISMKPFSSLSDVTSQKEAWNLVDLTPDEQLFPGISVALNSTVKQEVTRNVTLPVVLHYDQVYRLGHFSFNKKDVIVPALMECAWPRLVDIPLTLHLDASAGWNGNIKFDLEPRIRRRLSFVLRTTVVSINKALLSLKDSCGHANLKTVSSPHVLRRKEEGEGA